MRRAEEESRSTWTTGLRVVQQTNTTTHKEKRTKIPPQPTEEEEEEEEGIKPLFSPLVLENVPLLQSILPRPDTNTLHQTPETSTAAPLLLLPSPPTTLPHQRIVHRLPIGAFADILHAYSCSVGPQIALALRSPADISPILVAFITLQPTALYETLI